MGIHTKKNITKNIISNSPVQTSNKRLTNHSVRKALVKKLKRNNALKSEITSITGHSTDGGLSIQQC